MRTVVPALVLCLSLSQISCSVRKPPGIPANTWTLVTSDEKGARRASSFRYVPERGVFLLWGFHCWNVYIYGGPETPYDENTEYDIVAFDPDSARWLNEFPRGREQEWARELPPMYLSKFYHGITTGSYRTGLEMRDGVLRPDLNIVFDQVTWDSRRERMVFFTGGRTLAYDINSREWSDIGGEVTPPPVLGGSLCYDPFNDEIVLAGGAHVAETGPQGELRGWAGTWIYTAPRVSGASCKRVGPSRRHAWPVAWSAIPSVKNSCFSGVTGKVYTCQTPGSMIRKPAPGACRKPAMHHRRGPGISRSTIRAADW